MIKARKIIFMFIITMILTIVCGQNVLAAQPSTIGPIVANGTVGSNSDVYFNLKEAGNYKAFCTSGLLTPSPFGNTCKLKTGDAQWSDAKQAAIGAIIAEYQNKNINGTYGAYWYAEVAINSYLKPGSMEVNGSQAEKKDEVIRLVNLARAAETKVNTDFSINLSANNLTFTKSGNYYVSNAINVTAKYLDSYDVIVKGVKGVEVVDKNNNSFKVRFPISSVELGQTVKVSATVTGEKSYKVAKNYDCGSGVQDLTIDYTETKVINANKDIEGTVTRDGNEVQISKKDATTGKELPGATLIVKDANGKEIDKWVSTNEPHIIKNLTAGKYTLTETIAPEGYKLSTKTVTFEVKEDGKATKVEMENEPVKTGARISKKDATTGKELPGATLVVKNSKGKEVAKWVSTNEPKYIELEPGDYTLTETIAPEGYKLSTKTVKFTVKKDGTTTPVEMENEPVKTGARISKKDATTGKELPGATLVVKNSKGKEVAKWVSTNEPKYIELEPGDYTLTETIAPEGYKLSTKTVKFTVKKDGTTTKVEMENEPVKTGAKISKQDITQKGNKNGKELPGATLVVKDSEGKEVAKWVSTNEPKYIELKPGKYTLTETIAPVGYKLTSETIEFEVKNDGTTTKVIMYNEVNKNGVKISKQDITTKTELPGATLVVKDKNGVEIAKWVSGNEPVYIELEPGDYTLTEVTAPNGYDLSYEVVKFTVNEDGKAVTDVVMYNSKTPQTSDKNLLITVVGLISAGIIGAVAIKKIKHQM